ncbi:MAG: TIGR00295 family protein [Candidatus Diapherotrites archaeon]|nr:TIGR00295 family protein [Candidatus Diapherotrites archaeon]
MITEDEALLILREEGVPENVIEHSKTVAREAVRIANHILPNGINVDVDFVRIAALLHDIGRSRSHGIDHGVIGAEILRARGLPKFADVAERHIGAGITAEEAKQLGLPERDMVPVTIEEKIIAHADNIVMGNKVVSIDETLKKFERKLGKNSPVLKRIKQLADEIESLM